MSRSHSKRSHDSTKSSRSSRYSRNSRYSRTSSGSSRSSNLPKELSVLLWNIWCLPGPLSDNFSRTRALSIPSHISSNDIILLNEAFTHKQILTKAFSSTHPHMAYLPRRSYFLPTIFDSGLMIFSKYPIISKQWIYFSSRSKWDRFAGKGCLMVKINLFPAPSESKNIGSEKQMELVDIYVTHMQAGNSPGEQASREAQAKQLGDFIRTNSVDSERVIFGGDLNMGPCLDSVHYDGDKDASDRVNSYITLRNGSGLGDVEVENWLDGKEGDINRFLYRGVEILGVEYPEMPCIEDSKGRGCKLSDSDIVRLRVGGF